MPEAGVHLRHRPNRLPKRFPVGTTYVVEGCGGETGSLRVISRYVVLPGGQRINIPADFAVRAAPRTVACRRHAVETKVKKTSKNRARRTRKKIGSGIGTRRQ